MVALSIAPSRASASVPSTGDIRLWAIYVSVVAVGARVMAFAVQYVVFRTLVTRRIRAAGA